MENSYTTWKEQQEDLKEEICQVAEEIISDTIDIAFAELHDRYNTISGDITPEQQGKLESLIEQISELVAEQVYQNIKQ